MSKDMECPNCGVGLREGSTAPAMYMNGRKTVGAQTPVYCPACDYLDWVPVK